jgi:hypothetical protein
VTRYSRYLRGTTTCFSRDDSGTPSNVSRWTAETRTAPSGDVTLTTANAPPVRCTACRSRQSSGWTCADRRIAPRDCVQRVSLQNHVIESHHLWCISSLSLAA